MGELKLRNDTIVIYWWNMGRKTLEFKGSYADYFEKKGITSARIPHPSTRNKGGWRFNISMSSCTVTLDTFDTNDEVCYDDAIKVFLTLMGDRALFYSPRRKYCINYAC